MPNPQISLFPAYLKIDVGERVPGWRSGVLFRSAWGIEPGLLAAINDPMWKVDMRGPKYVTPEEVALDHSRIKVIPVEQTAVSAILSAHATRAEYAANYAGILGHCGPALGKVVESIAVGIDDGGCVLGCSLGRDRTGLVLGLIQRGLGVSLPGVLAAEERMRADLGLLIEISPYGFDGMSREEILNRLRTTHEPLIDCLEECERRWGSVRGYFAAHNLDPDVWARLERALLARLLPVQTQH